MIRGTDPAEYREMDQWAGTMRLERVHILEPCVVVAAKLHLLHPARSDDRKSTKNLQQTN
jgi:hypothetical protein